MSESGDIAIDMAGGVATLRLRNAALAELFAAAEAGRWLAHKPA